MLIHLPEQDYECPVWQQGKVHRDCHVVFEGSFYSLPAAYMGKPVWVRAGLSTIEFFINEKRVKVHPRAKKKGLWVTDKTDYTPSAQAFLNKDFKACLAQAKRIGPSLYTITQQLAQSPSQTHCRKAQALLRLSEEHTDKRLEAACKRALKFNNTEYKSIKRILEHHFEREEEEVVTTLVDTWAYLRDAQEFSFGQEACL